MLALSSSLFFYCCICSIAVQPTRQPSSSPTLPSSSYIKIITQNYLGCYGDNSLNNRVLPANLYIWQTGYQKCFQQAQALGYRYVGLEDWNAGDQFGYYVGECWAGNSLSSAEGQGVSTNCAQVTSTDGVVTWGGGDAIALYDLSVGPTLTPTNQPVTFTPSMAAGKPTAKPSTAKPANNPTTSFPSLPTSQPSQCPTRQPSRFSLVPYYANIYSVTNLPIPLYLCRQPTLQPTRQPSSRPTTKTLSQSYLGCFVDFNNYVRVLPKNIYYHQTGYLACFQQAQALGYRYVGLEAWNAGDETGTNAGECWAGNSLTSAESQGVSTNCAQVASTDGNVIWAGGLSIALYDLSLVPSRPSGQPSRQPTSQPTVIQVSCCSFLSFPLSVHSLTVTSLHHHFISSLIHDCYRTSS